MRPAEGAQYELQFSLEGQVYPEDIPTRHEGVASSRKTCQSQDVAPRPHISGLTNPERIAESFGAPRDSLSADEEREVRKACKVAEVAGPRYPESVSSTLFADTAPLS